MLPGEFAPLKSQSTFGPAGFPTFLHFPVCEAGYGDAQEFTSYRAVALIALVIVSVHVVLVPVQSPLHPVNVYPVFVCAVSVTDSPAL